MARRKRLRSVATFKSTQGAMEAEMACEKAGVEGRLIPTPVAIRATCGLSWAMDPDERPAFEKALEGTAIEVESITEVDI